MTERPKFPVAVHVLLLNQTGDEVLLFKRQHTGYRDGHYTGPAGHFEGNQILTVEAARETLEEVGVGVDPNELIFVCLVHMLEKIGNNLEYFHVFYLAKNWKGIPKLRESKSVDLGWHSILHLPSPMVPEVAAGIMALSTGIKTYEI